MVLLLPIVTKPATVEFVEELLVNAPEVPPTPPPFNTIALPIE